MPPADLDTGLHALAGQSAALDALVEFAAQNLAYVAVALFAVLWWRSDGLRAGLASLAGALLGLGLGALVGAAWNRPRPFVAAHFAPLVAHGADASFPSDHLIVLGALAAGAWLCWRWVGAALGGVAAGLGLARAVTGIHYLSDVLGGFAIGALLTVAAWHLAAPLMPLVDGVDGRLRRLRLRPPPAAAPPSRRGR